MSLYVILTVTGWLIPTIRIWVNALFLDTAVGFLTQGQGLARLGIFLVLLGLILLVNILISPLAEWCRQRIENEVERKYKAALVQKTSGLYLEDIENPQIADRILRVRQDASDHVMKGMDGVLGIGGIIVQAAGFMTVLVFQVWQAVFPILVIFCLVAWMSWMGGLRQYRARQQVSGKKRQSDALEEMLLDRSCADERTLFSYLPFVQKKWDDAYMQARKKERAVVVKNLFQIKGISIAATAVTLACAFVLLWPIARGQISAGMFIALIQGAQNLVSLLSWDLSDQVAQAAVYREYLKDLRAFLKLREQEGILDAPAPEIPKLERIEFSHVSFAYPGSKRKVLDDLSFVMEKDRHYALVGANGAGKTTIIKLLTELYEDFEGEIRINGRSIREYSRAELKSYVTVLFQDFGRFEVSVYDNMTLGNEGRGFQREDTGRIQSLLKDMGLWEMCRSLPRGLNTILGKLSEDGVDLSGGQWQKLAMIRVLLSPSPLVVLDEPTAALDPISESQLYENFARISQKRTALLITHRLGSVSLADQILVLDHGQVREQGTHSELMAENGLYKLMYESQRGWYDDRETQVPDFQG
ncbi:MAG TPA: ABC transporter ATP-binding protein [Candidatus Scybalocola faecavium]|nr:ABC transporter ATP-binding protein [Candidatus Scybalocola faecavium]